MHIALIKEKNCMTITNVKPDQSVGAISPSEKPISPEQRKVTFESKRSNVEAGDKIELSPTSKELQKIYTFLQNIPEQRSAKIAKLKESIAEGNYQVDAQALSEKLVKEFLPEILQ